MDKNQNETTVVAKKSHKKLIIILVSVFSALFVLFAASVGAVLAFVMPAFDDSALQNTFEDMFFRLDQFEKLESVWAEKGYEASAKFNFEHNGNSLNVGLNATGWGEGEEETGKGELSLDGYPYDGLRVGFYYDREIYAFGGLLEDGTYVTLPRRNIDEVLDASVFNPANYTPHSLSESKYNQLRSILELLGSEPIEQAPSEELKPSIDRITEMLSEFVALTEEIYIAEGEFVLCRKISGGLESNELQTLLDLVIEEVEENEAFRHELYILLGVEGLEEDALVEYLRALFAQIPRDTDITFYYVIGGGVVREAEFILKTFRGASKVSVESESEFAVKFVTVYDGDTCGFDLTVKNFTREDDASAETTTDYKYRKTTDGDEVSVSFTTNTVNIIGDDDVRRSGTETLLTYNEDTGRYALTSEYEDGEVETVEGDFIISAKKGELTFNGDLVSGEGETKERERLFEISVGKGSSEQSISAPDSHKTFFRTGVVEFDSMYKEIMGTIDEHTVDDTDIQNLINSHKANSISDPLYASKIVLPENAKVLHGAAVTDVAYDEESRLIAVSDKSRSTVSLYNIDTFELVCSFEPDRAPGKVALGEGYLAVANADNNVINIYRLTDGGVEYFNYALVGSSSIGTVSDLIIFDGKLFMCASADISYYDFASGQNEKIAKCTHPATLFLNEEKQRIAIIVSNAATFSSALGFIDTVTCEITDQFELDEILRTDVKNMDKYIVSQNGIAYNFNGRRLGVAMNSRPLELKQDSKLRVVETLAAHPDTAAAIVITSEKEFGVAIRTSDNETCGFIGNFYANDFLRTDKGTLLWTDGGYGLVYVD